MTEMSSPEWPVRIAKDAPAPIPPKLFAAAMFAMAAFVLGFPWLLALRTGSVSAALLLMGWLAAPFMIGFGAWALKVAPTYRPPVRDDF